MTSHINGDEHPDLVCPVCIDVFDDPTILACGHTFCKSCLVSCDERRPYRGQIYISCPICRARTTLGNNRVAGLTPNLLVRGMLDGDNSKGSYRSAFLCQKHKQLYNDIYCVQCELLICLTCYHIDHKDHEIKKREELEGNMSEEVDTLLEKGMALKAEAEKELREAKRQSEMIRCHIGHLQVQIRDAFDRKVTVLEQHQERLLKKLDEVGAELDMRMNDFTLGQEFSIYQMKQPISTLKGRLTSTYLPPEEFERTVMYFERLKRFLEQENVLKRSDLPYLKKAEKIQFHPSTSDINLEIGKLEFGE